MPKLAGPAVLSEVPTSDWTQNLIADGDPAVDTDDSVEEQDEEPDYTGGHGRGDFYDEDLDSSIEVDDDRPARFGPMLNGSPPGQAKQRDQMADAKRKLSYRMSVIGERAAGWWGSLKSQVQASTEGDRQAETTLLKRLDELTGHSFIGATSDKTLHTLSPGTPLGFQIGSAAHLRGARISSITAGSAASAAGLEIGDVIVAIQGKNALGLAHEDVIKMVKDHSASQTRIQIVTASPLDVKIPSDNMCSPGTNVATRPKPPSYMVVRNKLMEEFGEDTYNRCKRKVQIHMEQLAGKYDEMAGVEKAPELSNMELLQKKIATGREIAAVKYAAAKQSATVWVNDRMAKSQQATLEREDEERLIAARADKQECLLHELLSKILMAPVALPECPDAFSVKEGDKGQPQLSYSGVRLYLIAETSAACFDRNRPFVQGKLQERELSKLSYGRSGSAKPIAIGAAPSSSEAGFDNGSMLVSI